MFYDYAGMFDRTLKISSDIHLFENSEYAGFVTCETIEKYFDEYYKSAVEKAENLPWDYVVLYAVLEYGGRNQGITSANFMALEMPYMSYIKIIGKLFNNRRFFFMRGRKEFYYE